MKRIISLVLLLALVGIAVADVPIERRLPSPQFNLGILASGLPGWQGWVAPMLLQMMSLPYRQVPARSAMPPSYIEPPAPVCDLLCPLRPLRGIGE